MIPLIWLGFALPGFALSCWSIMTLMADDRSMTTLGVNGLRSRINRKNLRASVLRGATLLCMVLAGLLALGNEVSWSPTVALLMMVTMLTSLNEALDFRAEQLIATQLDRVLRDDAKRRQPR